MIRFTAFALTVLTGFSGLVYEVTWHKYLATLLGSHSEATAAVLAIFLGGLSAGYALFGALTRRLVARARRLGRPERLLWVYGAAEAGIGLYALLFPVLFGLAQQVSLWVPASTPGLAFAFDIALSTLLIGPPTVLMGGTIPILTLALAGDLEHSTRIHAWVYGFNTIGSFAGALSAAFWIIPSLGLDGTLYAMAVVNLGAGATFVGLDRRARRLLPDFSETASAAPARFAAYAGVALLAGFAMMTLQTTLNRIGALAFGSSPFTFAMIAAVFVLCIALGSLLVSALPKIPERLLDGSQWVLLLLLGVLYLQLADAPYWAHVVRAVFRDHEGAFYPFYFFAFSGLLAVLALPIALSGALLPLIFDRLRREMGDLGAVAGRLYAWNTVGSLLGALIGGYVLLFWLDLHHVYRVALAALALGATLLTAMVSRRSVFYATCFLVLPAWLGLAALPSWSPERLTAGLFRSRDVRAFTFKGPDAVFEYSGTPEIVFYDDDPTSTVSVTRVEYPDGGESHSIIVNGKSDGNLVGDYVTMSLAALLPALMAEQHERAFVIGLGTGVTVGELASLEGTRQVDVAEISRGVIAAAPLFEYGNLQALQSPKVRVQRGDAYRTLLRSAGQYDVIVSEPSNPWVTGVEMLFSREFLETARSRLSPGGVYAQWFHLYEVDQASVEIVLRTYASVFPHVSVWFAQGSDLLLLGFNEPSRALDVEALASRFAQPDFRAAFERSEIANLAELLAHELMPMGALHAAEWPGEVHTLRKPILSDRAARAFFAGRSARLPLPVDPASRTVGAANSLLRRHAGVADTPLPEDVLEAALDETCGHRRVRECVTLLASWIHDHPPSRRRAQAIGGLRRQLGARRAVSPRVIASVASLFGAEAAAASAGDGVPLRRVLRSTDQFRAYYHHAVPFDAEVIRDRWRRCAGERCQETRRRAVDLLGFDLPGPDEGAG